MVPATGTAEGRRPHSAPAVSAGGAPLVSRTAEIADDAAAALTAVGPEDQARFWRARARALEADLANARTQLLQLARCLPLAMAERLDSNETALADLVAVDDLLDGWVETTTLWPSSVSAEMARLWSRLRRNHD